MMIILHTLQWRCNNDKKKECRKKIERSEWHAIQVNEDKRVLMSCIIPSSLLCSFLSLSLSIILPLPSITLIEFESCDKQPFSSHQLLFPISLFCSKHTPSVVVYSHSFYQLCIPFWWFAVGRDASLETQLHSWSQFERERESSTGRWSDSFHFGHHSLHVKEG